MYLDRLDQFVKQVLKSKHYYRYADDFVIVHEQPEYLEGILLEIKDFLKRELLLELHPNKVSIRKFSQGIDFLGYVILPKYIVLRTKTKQRMFKKINKLKKELKSGTLSEISFNQSVQSYLGLLQHCQGYKLRKKLLDLADNR